MRPKAVFSWSGGKDSALALQKVLENKEFEIIALLTTTDAATGASSIHNIPEELLSAQAERIGIPLYKVPLSKNIQNYEQAMRATARQLKEAGITHFIFGDIFLEDVKEYRERLLGPLGIEIVLPLSGKTSEEVMHRSFCSGIRSVIVVTQADKLNSRFIGKELTPELMEEFPKNIDVCGENGEYHSFVFDAPFFAHPIDFEILSTNKISYTFKLDTGEKKEVEFFQAVLQKA